MPYRVQMSMFSCRTVGLARTAQQTVVQQSTFLHLYNLGIIRFVFAAASDIDGISTLMQILQHQEHIVQLGTFSERPDVRDARALQLTRLTFKG